jgi:hypothetical protein
VAEAEAEADGGALWLPSSSDDVYISVNATVVTINNAHDIELRDMDIMYAKSIALTADNVTRVLIQNVSIGNTGGQGMEVGNSTLCTQ